MTAPWIACGVLALGLGVMLVKHLRYKNDIRQLGRRLSEIIQSDTNAQLTTQTFDKDIAALTQSANALLAKSRHDYVKALRLEADLKRAISNISHDLRTPLTSAKGYLQMLEGQAANAARQKTAHLTPSSRDENNPLSCPSEEIKDISVRYLNIIRGRLDTLASLMNNLFAFSRAMEENISIKQVNIGNILRDALTDSYAELENKGFTVESSIPDTPVYCSSDEDALKRVFQNLIKNAYVHGKKYLRVRLKDNIIEIANKANGLNELDISRIFDRFYTADAARTHKRTGLGLAIAKELTERMGGTISALQEDDMLVVRICLPQ